MTLVRWRPSRDLLNINSDFDRLFSDFFGNSLNKRYNGSERTIYPSIDLSESDKEFVVKAELPGVDKDNVKISLQENILTNKRGVVFANKKFLQEKTCDNFAGKNAR